MALVKATN